jgi:SAM-dependent methyltransferase
MNYTDSFGFQWNKFDRTQLDEYWGADISGERFLKATGWTDLTGQVLLEAGCGMGRFTSHAIATGAEVISVDYSSAVQAAQRNNPSGHFAQADIRKLPFKPATFDKILCIGVLQHTPDPRASFMALVDLLKPGGEIVADIYRLSWKTPLYGYYWLRLLTKGRDPRLLFPWVERYFNLTYPWAKGKLAAIAGIADYRGVFDISPDKMRELCLLDTFDRLSPAHDHPRSMGQVRRWLGDLEGEVKALPNIVEVRARKPDRHTG